MTAEEARATQETARKDIAAQKAAVEQERLSQMHANPAYRQGLGGAVELLSAVLAGVRRYTLGGYPDASMLWCSDGTDFAGKRGTVAEWAYEQGLAEGIAGFLQERGYSAKPYVQVYRQLDGPGGVKASVTISWELPNAA